MCTCFSMAIVIPSGIGNSIGCEYPSASTTFLPFTSARYPTPTISRSFLNPVVTPVTAFATSARAKPCSARLSSDSRFAVRMPSFCSKLIPFGTTTRILPLGPCTSTASSLIWIFTPDGTGIILFPIRDMALFDPRITEIPADPLPDLAHDFAADAGLARRLPGHQALGRRHNRNPHSAHYLPDVRLAHIPPRSRPRDALQVRDYAAAVRRVAQKQAQRLFRLLLFHNLEIRQISFLFQDARQLHLQLRAGQIHARVLRARGVANSRQ